MLKTLAREPLVHFMLLALALFFIEDWRSLVAKPDSKAEIAVSEARIRSLAQNFSRTWRRPPTRAELDGLVEDHVREEIMVREALALGLDRDDAIIRRRLQQKMEFVTEAAAALEPPTEEELQAYLQANPGMFRTEPRATFAQVYLDPRKRAATLDADARRLLLALNASGAKAAPAITGDAPMPFDPRYENATRTDIARLFGSGFADALFGQALGQWAGPITSGFGVHLVRLDALAAGGTPALADVRPQVEREWVNARRNAFSKAHYDSLRKKYKVTVSMPGAPSP